MDEQNYSLEIATDQDKSSVSTTDPCQLAVEDPPPTTLPSSKPKFRNPYEKKNKLRTSKDVYDRLKWAAGSTGIDVSTVHIGYLDRFLGMCEIAFIEYDPTQSDIPYHRIYYFRSGGPPISPIVGEQGEICVRESNWPPGSVIHWDRESRIDLIFGSGETSTNTSSNTTSPAKKREKLTQGQEHQLIRTPKNYRPVPSYKFNTNTQEWEIFDSTYVPFLNDKPSLKIISFNVLFDHYDLEVVQCEARWPYLIDFLESTDADLIALQEVTNSFLTLLQEQPWVQDQYYLSDISDKSITIQPYGQLLLSKFPPCAIYFGKHQREKRWIFGSFLINQHILHVPVIHLKSDHSGVNNYAKRRSQLESLIAACTSASSSTNNYPVEIMIIGDTNLRNTDSIADMTEIVDVWPLVSQEGDTGWTYDVTRNPIARLNSRNHIIARFDRILINSASSLLKPMSMKVVGTELIDMSVLPKCSTNPIFKNNLELLKKGGRTLALSDHYGLQFEVELLPSTVHITSSTISIPATVERDQSTLSSPSVQHKPVYTSSVVIIPPKEVWPEIQKIRSKYDPSYTRWMPHINLLYGFIHDTGSNFDHAQEIFNKALQSFQPFQCKLSDLSIFKHGKSSTTVYLAPDPSQCLSELKSLQQKLQAQFPLCSEQAEKSLAGFTPHLSVGKLWQGKGKDSNNIQDKLAEWRNELFGTGSSWANEFMIDRIYLISRTKDSPFEVQKTIYFGSRSPIEDMDSVGGMEIDLDVAPIVSQSPRGTPATAARAPDDCNLVDFLQTHNLLPTVSHEQLRVAVFNELQNLCNIVLNSATHGKEGFNWNSVHLIGSGAMGFHNDKSDIDALCCGTSDLSHEKFFDQLRKMVSSTKLSLQHVVLDTLVPLAKLSMDGVEIDLVYSTCCAPWDLKDKDVNLMSDMDIRSVAGVRDVKKLKSLIPDTWMTPFQLAVRGIKYWAKRRNIYSKGFGYLGGYPLGLLVAYVVVTVLEENDNDNEEGDGEKSIVTPEKLIQEFFYQFANWKWPTPVKFHAKLKKPKQPNSIPELMPILAPAFPYNNAARNVTKSTRSLLRKEFQRGHDFMSRKSRTFAENWKIVVEPAPFFDTYQYYLEIKISSTCAEASQICHGFLESKLVGLLVNLEKRSIFVQPYTKVHFSKEGHELIAFVGIDFKNSSTASPAELGSLQSSIIEYFLAKFNSWKYKPASSIMTMNILHCDNDSDILKTYEQIL